MGGAAQWVGLVKVQVDLLERFPGEIGVLSPEEGSSSCQFQPSQNNSFEPHNCFFSKYVSIL